MSPGTGAAESSHLTNCHPFSWPLLITFLPFLSLNLMYLFFTPNNKIADMLAKEKRLEKDNKHPLCKFLLVFLFQIMYNFKQKQVHVTGKIFFGVHESFPISYSGSCLVTSHWPDC